MQLACRISAVPRDAQKKVKKKKKKVLFCFLFFYENPWGSFLISKLQWIFTE